MAGETTPGGATTTGDGAVGAGTPATLGFGRCTCGAGEVRGVDCAGLGFGATLCTTVGGTGAVPTIGACVGRDVIEPVRGAAWTITGVTAIKVEPAR